MRSKLLPAVLLTLALAGAAASSAQAANEYHGFTGTVNSQTKGGEQLLESTLAGSKVLISCASMKGTGTLTATSGEGKDELTSEACKLATLTGAHVEEVLVSCTVASIVSKSKSLLKEHLGIEYSPQVTNITEIKITGAACAVKGTYALTGSQQCAMPRGESSREVHAILCNGLGSALKLATSEARLSGSYEENLESKAFWYRD